MKAVLQHHWSVLCELAEVIIDKQRMRLYHSIKEPKREMSTKYYMEPWMNFCTLAL